MAKIGETFYLVGKGECVENVIMFLRVFNALVSADIAICLSIGETIMLSKKLY